MAVNDIVFGTDGFRGLIARDFSFDNVKRIAQGLSDYMAYKGLKSPDKKVVIGYDRRFMSEEFARQFALVLRSNGISCVLSQTPLPTPAISLLTHKKYALGVVITASHNHYLYNGVKIKYQGRSIPPVMTGEIESHIPKVFNHPLSDVEIEKKDFRKEYCEYLNSKFDFKKLLSRLKGKIVIDFMYGASAEVCQEIFCGSKNVIVMNSRRDPLFGKSGAPEPVEKNLLELSKAVKENKALLGLALDGDGDRFAMLDDKGVYLTPCQIAPMLFERLLETQKKPGKVVQAVSMGYLTKRIAKQKNILLEELPVGFKFIAEKMISEEVLFGVEESGGYAWKGNIPERDGLMTALAFINLVVEKNRKISEIYKELEGKYGKSAFLRRDFKISKAIPNKHSFAVKVKKKLPKKIFDLKVSEAMTLDGLKIILENDWWFLIRPSGTEPLLRIYAETDSAKNTEKLLDFAQKNSVI